MITLFTISSIICLGFILIVLKLFDLNSISQSYYELGKIDKKYNILFSLWAVLSSLTLLPVLFELVPDPYKIFAFLSGLGLFFVGGAPHFYEEHEGKIHFTSAAICLISSFILQIIFNLKISAILTGLLYIIIILLSLIFKHSKVDKKRILYLELVAFSSMYLAILIKLIEYESK